MNYIQFIRELSLKRKYIVFYGCGAIFDSIVETWNQYVNLPVDFCCDTDSVKWGKKLSGVNCISPLELFKIKQDCTVFITMGDYQNVVKFLKQNDFPSVNLIYKYDIVYAEKQFSEKETLNLQNTFEILSDNKSKLVLNTILLRRALNEKNNDLMLDIYEENQYFPRDLISFHDKENFVDVGAYNGDTIKLFLNQTCGLFDNIFAFELDTLNFQELQKTIEKIKVSPVQSFNVGAYSNEQTIFYSNNQSQSTVGDGKILGQVVKLDDCLKDNKITFIKMDIEGCELQALQGASHIIQTQKPQLAICVYHKIEDLWEIPLYLKQLVPEYKIYFRHHSRLEYETVCYATTRT